MVNFLVPNIRIFGGEDASGLLAIVLGDDLPVAAGLGSSQQPREHRGTHQAGATGGVHGLQRHLCGWQTSSAGDR